MKHSIKKAVAFFLVASLLLSVEVIAGGRNRVGTNAAAELLIPVGARYIAMGGASVATVSGIDAIYYNPAGLSRSTFGATAMFSHMSYIANMGVDYIGVAANFNGFGHLGFTLKTLNIGDINVTTEDAPDGTGEKFSPTFVTFGATYSRTLTDRIGVGFTAKLISESINRVSASGFAFDFGVQYRDLGDINGLSIGVCAKNIGGAMKFDGASLLRQADVLDVNRSTSFYKVEASSDELPSTIELGVAYTRPIGEKSKLNFVSLFQNNNYDDDEIKFGGEMDFNNIFFARAGYNWAPDAPDDATGAKNAYIFGVTLGGGFHYDIGGVDLALDYAWRETNFFDANNVFTVRLGF